MINNKLIESIREYEEEAFLLNYDLADNPELPSKEYRSSKKIQELLEKHNIKCEGNYCDLETAFKGEVINKDAKYNIGILTEYDALPGVGHGCGHSASAAISVLSALVLKGNENLINANVDIIGTPDEEDKGLKVPMVERGVFDKYDFVIMAHLGSKYSIPNWRLIAFETHEIEFIGKESHTAAAPWDGRSALDGLMLSIHAIDMMRKMMRPGVIIEGIIQEGGISPNIIPGKARAKYTFRSTDASLLEKEIRPWLNNILKGCALATETTYKDKIFDYPFSDMNYNETGSEVIKSVMKENNIKFLDTPDADGSSDIGNVSYRCPAFHPSIAITDEWVPLHTSQMVDLVKSKKSEEAIVKGATVILGFISKLLDNPEIINKMNEEFKESLKQS
ncbi:amidohydrolase [Peptoniphilus obesi]|uniref:amidohydrolase n=1 Tax=Peptoniphilus obesi TaxID=1472765 RepID=UPI0004AE04A6|nr:amidohydrolase [Peptoniphilus obesi]